MSFISVLVLLTAISPGCHACSRSNGPLPIDPTAGKVVTPGDNYLMVIGGTKKHEIYFNATLASVEVISLFPDVDPVPKCMKNISDFPYPLLYGVGANIDGMQSKH